MSYLDINAAAHAIDHQTDHHLYVSRNRSSYYHYSAVVESRVPFDDVYIPYNKYRYYYRHLAATKVSQSRSYSISILTWADCASLHPKRAVSFPQCHHHEAPYGNLGPGRTIQWIFIPPANESQPVGAEALFYIQRNRSKLTAIYRRF
jgi:hypothetical protein